MKLFEIFPRNHIKVTSSSAIRPLPPLSCVLFSNPSPWQDDVICDRSRSLSNNVILPAKQHNISLRKGCPSCKSVQDAFSAAAQLLQYHSVTFSAYQCAAAVSRVLHCAGKEPILVLHETSTNHQVYEHSLTSSRDMYNFISSLRDEL